MIRGISRSLQACNCWAVWKLCERDHCKKWEMKIECRDLYKSTQIDTTPIEYILTYTVLLTFTKWISLTQFRSNLLRTTKLHNWECNQLWCELKKNIQPVCWNSLQNNDQQFGQRPLNFMHKLYHDKDKAHSFQSERSRSLVWVNNKHVKKMLITQFWIGPDNQTCYTSS